MPLATREVLQIVRRHLPMLLREEGLPEIPEELDFLTIGQLFFPSFTAGSVLFLGTDGEVKENNANFFWDDANKRLGIGESSPSEALQLTETDASNTVGIKLQNEDSVDYRVLLQARFSFAHSFALRGFQDNEIIGVYSGNTCLLFGNIGINTNAPYAFAQMDVVSTTKGFLPPRMTTAQRNAIDGGSPSEPLVIYNLTTNALEVYNVTLGAWGVV